MGCGDACPIYPGKRYLDWELPDPASKPLEEVRGLKGPDRVAICNECVEVIVDMFEEEGIRK